MAASVLKMTFRTGNRRSDPVLRRAFTLIELIIVMGLLAIVISVGMPSLQGFFHGRTLDSEARRLLTLTRHGQSRAVSEGIPMILWVDAREGTYGLQAQAGYLDEDKRANEYELGQGLEIEASAPPINSVTSTGTQPNRSAQKAGELPMIRFTPDGFIADSSPEHIEIRDTRGSVVWIARSGNRLNYEIQTAPTSR